MESVLTIQNLCKSYGSTEVLSNLNLEVPEGSIFGLIGPNGAGKSTLLGILTGILPFEQGSISICGLPWNTKNEPAIKRQTSSVMQPPLLFDHFSCFDYLDYIGEMYGMDREARVDKIDDLLSYFELDTFEANKTKNLSAGNKKKLAFVAAVLIQPKVLFLDEPFESVDVISIRRMKTILGRLMEKGTTVFITSHILEIIENMCDDIAILHRGNIIAYLDAASRAELEKKESLSEIFERYVAVDDKAEDLIEWL